MLSNPLGPNPWAFECRISGTGSWSVSSGSDPGPIVVDGACSIFRYPVTVIGYRVEGNPRGVQPHIYVDAARKVDASNRMEERSLVVGEGEK